MALLLGLERYILNKLLNFLLHLCILGFHYFALSNLWRVRRCFHDARLVDGTRLFLKINVDDFVRCRTDRSLQAWYFPLPLLSRYPVAELLEPAVPIHIVSGGLRCQVL